MNLHFDCIFYYVSELERAVSFYSNVLGLRLVSMDDIARFDVDGVLFELVPTDQEEKMNGKGNARLCLKVENISDKVRELEEKGLRVVEPEEVSNGWIASFYDSDGNEICLWQYESENGII